MKLTKDVYSSNLEFKPLEYNIDTVYKRVNERPWFEDDEQIGWIYDEMQYTLQEYHEEEKEDIWNELKYLRQLITELQNK